jgi:hypothetical protein
MLNLLYYIQFKENIECGTRSDVDYVIFEC